MKQSIPRPSHSNLRMFNACLLSFLLMVMPQAALSVGNHTITASYNGDAALNMSNGSLNTNPLVVTSSLSLMVNDTADTPDINIGDGLCADFRGKCTLRAALE